MKEHKLPIVSVIVPTKDSSQTIQACLESIKKQTYSNVELIIVDNDSTDNTKQISSNFTQLVFNKGPERSAQRNYGAKKSKGEYLIFIDSDMELSKNVITDCLKTIIKEKDLQALVIPEESFGEGFWAQCKKLERSFYLGVDWIESSRFFTRTAFEKIRGYDETLYSGEDWDIHQRIFSVYGKESIGKISSFIYHNEGHLTLRKTLSKKAYYMKKITLYKSKRENENAFSKQGSVITRYMLFFKQPGKLFKHPLLSVGMLFMKTGEFAAGGLGYVLRNI